MPSLNIPFGIAPGPDGNLWLGIAGGNNVSGAAIGRTSTDGAIDIFDVPESQSSPFGSIPGGLTPGPDGNVWFIERTSNARITRSGAIRVFATPTSGVPVDMTAGPDGNLWFTERGASVIGRITPEGVVTELPVPTSGENIVVGPDGALWFTQPESKIGRITTTGVASEIAIPASASDIASGPDGSIWLTSASSPTIWRMSLDHAPVIELRVLPVVGSTPGLAGSYFRTSLQLHNPAREPALGRIVFHPTGVSGSASDPSLF
jgi:virginiamycin B lyase